MFEFFWWNYLVLGIGAFAIFWLATHKPTRVTTAHLIVLVSIILGIIGYTRFGQMHGTGRTYHYSEVWHYYLGSKYYKEVSQKYLYVDIIGAFSELASKEPVPHPPSIRNLQQPYESFTPDGALAVFKKEGKPRFTEKRWDDFKRDVERFLHTPWSEYDWQAVADVGYNPPPTFSVVVGSIASLITINQLTLTLIPFIDFALILLACFVLFRTFGFLAAAIFLLIFLTNDLASLYWIGGSFCRFFWVTSLTLALCALEKKRYYMAGLAFGFATSLRVFPLAFLLAACLPFVIDLIHNFRQTFRKPAALLAGAITVIIPLLLLSLVLYPWSNWLDFAEKINGHNKTFFVMHLGYDKLAASTITSAPQFFFNNTSNFENWNIYLNDRINEHWQFHRCVALLFFAGAIFAGLKADIKMSCLLVGETILFFFALPANYYYIYLAAFGAVAVVALQQKNTLGTRSRFWGLILFLVVCNMVAGFSNDWIKLNWGINLGLFILLALYVFSQAIEQCTTKFRLRLLLTIVSVVIVGFFTFHPRNLVSTNSNGLKTQVLMFTPTDVKQGKAWYQDLHATEPFWPTKEQVLIQCVSNKIVVSKTFVVPIAHYYKISLYYATAPDYVKHLLIRCAGQFGEMGSWSPNVNITQASFGLTLPAGTNTITILADGNPKNELLGINSLIIKPSL